MGEITTRGLEVLNPFFITAKGGFNLLFYAFRNLRLLLVEGLKIIFMQERTIVIERLLILEFPEFAVVLVCLASGPAMISHSRNGSLLRKHTYQGGKQIIPRQWIFTFLNLPAAKINVIN